jgi:hypothetical protein
MNAQIDPNSQQGGAPSLQTAAARPSFADEVRGTAPQQVDLTLAKLMRDVYDYDRNGQQEGVDRWKPLGADELRSAGVDPTLLKNESSGFLAVVYGDGQGRHVLAYSGTDEAKDWATNLGQGLGFETSQYNQAIALAKQAKVAFGEEMVITGHSLGGGLAAAAAVATDTPAITYNAAGVHDKTYARIGLDADAVKSEAENGLIRRYAVKNDILTDLQEHTPVIRHLMPDAVGHKIELSDPDPLSFWQKLNPVKSVKHGVEMHMIDAVIAAQEKTYGHTLEAKNGLMSHPDHAFHPQYQRTFDHLQPEMAAQGIGMRETQNAAGALALESHRKNIVPDRVALGDNLDRAFAVQGDRAETQRYAQIDLHTGMQTPLIDSSRQSIALLAAQPQQSSPQPVAPQPAPEPAQEQANSPRGR